MELQAPAEHGTNGKVDISEDVMEEIAKSFAPKDGENGMEWGVTGTMEVGDYDKWVEAAFGLTRTGARFIDDIFTLARYTHSREDVNLRKRQYLETLAAEAKAEFHAPCFNREGRVIDILKQLLDYSKFQSGLIASNSAQFTDMHESVRSTIFIGQYTGDGDPTVLNTTIDSARGVLVDDLQWQRLRIDSDKKLGIHCDYTKIKVEIGRESKTKDFNIFDYADSGQFGYFMNEFLTEVLATAGDTKLPQSQAIASRLIHPLWLGAGRALGLGEQRRLQSGGRGRGGGGGNGGGGYYAGGIEGGYDDGL